MLEISKEKLARIISAAKDHEENAGRWDQVVQNSFNDNEILPMAGGLHDPATNFSLAELFEELNDNEKASLIALSMIGRGEVDAADFDKAMALALAEDTDRATTYLLRIPMVADYLEEGLQKLGYSLNAGHAFELQNA